MDSGRLLHFIADEYIAECQLAALDDTTHCFKEDLDAGVEQAFYCLYGHPNKRAKAKHLQDHNVTPVSHLQDHTSHR